MLWVVLKQGLLTASESLTTCYVNPITDPWPDDILCELVLYDFKRFCE